MLGDGAAHGGDRQDAATRQRGCGLRRRRRTHTARRTRNALDPRLAEVRKDIFFRDPPTAPRPFDLVQVIYSLDGNQIYSATDDDGSLADRQQIELYNGTILPGPHNIAIEMTLVGNGYGLFSYLEGYRFRLRSSYAFTAEDGKITYLDIVAYEQGGINQPIEERPDIRYELEFADSVLPEE